MIAIRKLSWFVLVILTAALTACGDDDNGAPAPGGGGGGGGGTPQAVELDQLAGTWAGPFDSTNFDAGDTGDVQTLRFTITGDQIDYHDFADDLTGTVTKASEVSNAFRFTTTNQSGTLTLNGMMVVIPGATPYIVYVHGNGQVAALQKIGDGAEAPAVPEYVQTDIDGSWNGLTVKAMDAQFSGELLQTTSSASCEAADAASNCTVTIDETTSIPAATKNATGLTLNGPGRWIGTYADAGQARILLTLDKGFAGAWLCEDPAQATFPQTCDFSGWTKASN